MKATVSVKLITSQELVIQNANHTVQCTSRIIKVLVVSCVLLFSSAHLLQVTAMEGLLEEVVPLLSVIPASPRPQSWLVTLEQKMRNTLVRSLAECVDRRLRGRESPNKLLELITTFGKLRVMRFLRNLHTGQTWILFGVCYVCW